MPSLGQLESILGGTTSIARKIEGIAESDIESALKELYAFEPKESCEIIDRMIVRNMILFTQVLRQKSLKKDSRAIDILNCLDEIKNEIFHPTMLEWRGWKNYSENQYPQRSPFEPTVRKIA